MLGVNVMFKTDELYELISWLLLSMVWFGKGITRTTVSVESAQNREIFPGEAKTSEPVFEPRLPIAEESRVTSNEVWFYGEALALNRNKKNRSNERRRKDDRREGSAEDNKKAGE